MSIGKVLARMRRIYDGLGRGNTSAENEIVYGKKKKRSTRASTRVPVHVIASAGMRATLDYFNLHRGRGVPLAIG